MTQIISLNRDTTNFTLRPADEVSFDFKLEQRNEIDLTQTGRRGLQGATGPEGATGPVGASINILGELPDVGDLPSSGNTPGDAYIIDGNLWVWSTEDDWVDAGDIQGASGPTGPTGPAGANGSVGATGAQGATGSIGVTGATGPQGPQGTQGTQGATGIQGATGPQGVQGVQGNTGATGVAGSNGTQGATGATGATGASGDSAYDVAVEEGFVGTEEEWLESLIGATGPQGIQGDTGSAGSVGATGATGPQGSAGTQGATGAQGIQGVAGNTGATGVQGEVGINWLGDWEAGTYNEFDAVFNDGSSYVANTTTTEEPPHADWDLLAQEGDVGATGAQGVQGDTGSAGAQGATGATGPNGSAGSQGATGATGPVGATGATGPNNITTSTTTNLTGLLRGNGSTVAAATAAQIRTDAGADSAWHYIGAGGEPAFENSWVNFTAGYEEAAFRKDASGFVYLKGLVKDGVTTSDTVMFTLPAGYRPELRNVFTVSSNNAYGQIRVSTDGTVRFRIGTNAFVSLEGVVFYAV